MLSMLDALAAFGLPVNADRVVAYRPKKDWFSFIMRWPIKRDALPFDIDGIVYKVNSRELQAKPGLQRPASRAGPWRTNTRRRSR